MTLEEKRNLKNGQVVYFIGVSSNTGLLIVNDPYLGQEYEYTKTPEMLSVLQIMGNSLSPDRWFQPLSIHIDNLSLKP